MHEYGKTNWEFLWEKLEQEGNVGLDYVINPYLFNEILDFLKTKQKTLIVDFGCGTNMMGTQLLFGYQKSIPALKDQKDLDMIRFNTLLYLGIEGNKELVSRSEKYFQDIGSPTNIATVHSHIGEEITQLFDSSSVDLCVSRNFLMHLSIPDFKHHLEYVFQCLKPGGCYIFATLNPDYEKQKAGKDLQNGEKYEFPHGASGDYGVFYHYYKNQETYKGVSQEHFSIEKEIPCIPITNMFEKTHARYYTDVPMALVYVLRKPRKVSLVWSKFLFWK